MHFPILIWSAKEPLVINLFLSTCWSHSIEWAFEKIFLFQLNNKPDNLQRDVRQVPTRLHNHSDKLLSQETSQVPATLKNQKFTSLRTSLSQLPPKPRQAPNVANNVDLPRREHGKDERPGWQISQRQSDPKSFSEQEREVNCIFLKF